MAIHLSQQGFLGVYVRRALNREPLLVYGDGSQLRDPVHVDDVVNAFTLAGVAAEPRSRVINIGGPHARKLLEIAAILARLSGGSLIQETPFPNCVRQLDIGSYFSDTRRARRELKWIPQIAFEEGMRNTLSYYREYYCQYRIR